MPVASKQDLYRALPSVDELLHAPGVAPLLRREGQAAVIESIRVVLAELREQISRGRLSPESLPAAISNLERTIGRHLRSSLAYSLRTVVNGTGVILHTNLGRAPLSPEVIQHIGEIAAGYSNLEFDLESGDRGRRDVHVQRLLARLLSRIAPASGEGVRAEWKSLVVNNCAAAVLVVLNTLAEGGEVIVSRGELVEIGGSFRIPEIMAKSGAVLREVGTTNRTKIADYERAISERTRLILRVHRSNFAMVGFTEQPSIPELVELGRRHKLPVFEDQGNGSPLDLQDEGGVKEAGFVDSLQRGVDLVSYSGDKLLGGPQAGLITGGAELVDRIRGNPLFRALRAGKLTYAALEATLMAYIRSDRASIPIVRMLEAKTSELRRRAQALRTAILDGLETANHPADIELVEGTSLAGGGTAPTFTLPTCLLAIRIPRFSDHELQTRLRQGEPPIIARVEEGRVLLDLRTVFPEQDESLRQSLRALLDGI